VTALVLLDVSHRTTQAAQGAWIPEVFGKADAIATVAVDPGASNCPDCLARTDVEAVLPDGTRQLWSTQAGIPIRTPEQRRGRNVTVSNTNVTDQIYTDAYSLVSGRWPAADNQVALQPDLAKFLGVTLGDEFSLVHQSRRFEVVGLIESGGWRSEMIAPGFDFSVVRPSSLSDVGAFDLPGSFDVNRTDMNVGMYGELQIRPGSNGMSDYTDQGSVATGLILGWLGGVLAMSMLGVVTAAAFAISGRRQLVAVGQLSASGASQRTLARTFGLYGSLTAAVGVTVGVIAALVVHIQWPQWFNSGRHAVVNWLDIVVIAATAIAVATVAALAPTRSLTRVSVLSALAGRRPVGAVPRWLSRAGAGLFIGGLLVTLIAIRYGADGGGTEAGMLVALGMIAAVLGVCALAPRIIDRFGALASRRGGSIRLAARSMTRHRPRSAAVLASLLVVGMVAAGVAAAAEYRIQENEAEAAGDLPSRSDLVWVESRSEGFADDMPWSSAPLTLVDVASMRIEAERVIGPATWTSAALAHQPLSDPAENNSAMVATDEVLDLFDLSAQTRQAIADADGPVSVTRRAPAEGPQSDVFAPELQFDLQWQLMSPAAAQNENWAVVPQALEFGVASQDITAADQAALWLLSADNSEGLAYLGMDASGESTSWSVATYIYSDGGFRLTASQLRAFLLAASLLLVMLLVSIGMALWAVESRDERDVLVAVGASPTTLARVAGWRAGGLTFGAMLIAVPMGVLVSWAIARAVRGSIAIPWLLAALLLFAVPAVIGLGALACSALAQRVRPVRMSTLTAD